MSLDAITVPNDPEPLLTSAWKAHGYRAAEHRGKHPPCRLPAPVSQKQSQGKVVEGGIKLKLLSLIQADQQGGFLYQKEILPLKLVLHFLKANFRTNGESSHKIYRVCANSN